jgi:hypothetical protein
MANKPFASAGFSLCSSSVEVKQASCIARRCGPMYWSVKWDAIGDRISAVLPDGGLGLCQV